MHDRPATRLFIMTLEIDTLNVYPFSSPRLSRGVTARLTTIGYRVDPGCPERACRYLYSAFNTGHGALNRHCQENV